MIKSRLFPVLFSLFFILSACDESRVFEKNIDFEGYKWTYENKATFDVEIADNDLKTVFINFRHTYFFNTRNVILDLEVKTPADSVYTIPVDILLSEPNGMWHSECSGDICDFKFPIKEFTNYSFADTGNYKFTLTQNMRVNPLANVMGVGLRIEKANNK